MIEIHPWTPFLPQNAKILFLGTFPPKSNKWSMNFYYPNKINDFWRIMGKALHQEYSYYFNFANNSFDKSKIIEDMSTYGIGLGDTALKVKRLKDNASDKYLEIITAIDIIKILNNAPYCNTIVSTGQKAAEIIAKTTNTPIPKMGEYTLFNFSHCREIKIYRMPSTSRAYPLALEKKTNFYKKLLIETKII